MSKRAETLVWERSRAKGSCRLVLLAIADYARSDGRDAFPSTRLLADRSRLSERAVLLILHQLQDQGELLIEPNSELRRPDEHGRIPRWFLHVRCVCDWEAYQREGQSEKISDSRTDLSPPAAAAFRRGRPPGNPKSLRILPEKQSEKSRTEIRKIVHENPKSFQRIKGRILEQDPRTDPRTGGCAPDSLIEPPAETPNFWLIVKLAHETIEHEGERANEADLLDALKQRLHALGIPASPPVDLVGKALDAARWQRKHRMSAS